MPTVLDELKNKHDEYDVSYAVLQLPTQDYILYFISRSTVHRLKLNLHKTNY